MVTTISKAIAQGSADTAGLVLQANDTLNLLPNVYIIAFGGGLSSFGVEALGSDVLNLSGTIISTQLTGIGTVNGGNVFNIAASATIFGLQFGIVVSGDSNTFTSAGDIGSQGGAVRFLNAQTTFNNSGNIVGINGPGVEFFGDTNNVTNSGYISSETIFYGMLMYGINNVVSNSGTMKGATGIGFLGVSGVNALFNSGSIVGVSSYGFYSQGNAQDNIVNNGLIQGGINLGGGNDVYDGRGGTVIGTILGGDGNDIIYGGIGNETFQGGNNNDQIYGGPGADTISGDAGNDLIVGGPGADVLRGGLDADLFVFNVGDNGDLIKNFNEGGVRDGFDLRGYFDATGFTGADPRAAGIMQVLQNGANTDVYLHGAFAFRIEGVVAAAIDNSYFLIQ